MEVFAHKIRNVRGAQVAHFDGRTGDTFTMPAGSTVTIGGTLVTTGTLTIGAGATLTSPTINTPTIVSPVMKRAVEALTATRVLTAADSGLLLTLGTAGGFDTKLPAPAAGLNFLFVVKVAPTTAYTITTNGTTQNIIHGCTVNSAGTAGDSTAGTPVDVITFAANQAHIGDMVEVFCDGTLWYARGICDVAIAITFD